MLKLRAQAIPNRVQTPARERWSAVMPEGPPAAPCELCENKPEIQPGPSRMVLRAHENHFLLKSRRGLGGLCT